MRPEDVPDSFDSADLICAGSRARSSLTHSPASVLTPFLLLMEAPLIVAELCLPRKQECPLHLGHRSPKHGSSKPGERSRVLSSFRTVSLLSSRVRLGAVDAVLSTPGVCWIAGGWRSQDERALRPEDHRSMSLAHSALLTRSAQALRSSLTHWRHSPALERFHNLRRCSRRSLSEHLGCRGLSSAQTTRLGQSGALVTIASSFDFPARAGKYNAIVQSYNSVVLSASVQYKRHMTGLALVALVQDRKMRKSGLGSRSDHSCTDPNGLSLTFLGTSSGRSTLTRNGTSTVINFPWASWMVDCAEGTQRQMLEAGEPAPYDIRRIFITRICADDVFGLPALLGSILYRRFSVQSDTVVLHIYGPAGLRSFVRASMKSAELPLRGRYMVTELLLHSDSPTTCEPDEMHPNEAPGEDILASADEPNTWPSFAQAPEAKISAARLDGPQTSLGYVFEEPEQPFADREWLRYLDSIPREQLPKDVAHARQFVLRFADGDASKTLLVDGTPVKPAPATRPGRKIVILGATSDASRIEALAQDADIVVHEATLGPLVPQLPRWVSSRRKSKASPNAFRQGHSTAAEAGAFAARVNAQQLVLNRFASRFTGLSMCEPYPGRTPLDRSWHEYQCTAMVHLMEQAALAFGRMDVDTARDLLKLPVPFRKPEVLVAQGSNCEIGPEDGLSHSAGEVSKLSPEEMLLLAEWQSLSSPRYPAVRLRVPLTPTPPTLPTLLAPGFRFPIAKNGDQAMIGLKSPALESTPPVATTTSSAGRKKSKAKQKRSNGEKKVQPSCRKGA